MLFGGKCIIYCGIKIQSKSCTSLLSWTKYYCLLRLTKMCVNFKVLHQSCEYGFCQKHICFTPTCNCSHKTQTVVSACLKYGIQEVALSSRVPLWYERGSLFARGTLSGVATVSPRKSSCGHSINQRPETDVCQMCPDSDNGWFCRVIMCGPKTNGATTSENCNWEA